MIATDLFVGARRVGAPHAVGRKIAMAVDGGRVHEAVVAGENIGLDGGHVFCFCVAVEISVRCVEEIRTSSIRSSNLRATPFAWARPSETVWRTAVVSSSTADAVSSSASSCSSMYRLRFVFCSDRCDD